MTHKDWDEKPILDYSIAPKAKREVVPFIWVSGQRRAVIALRSVMVLMAEGQ